MLKSSLVSIRSSVRAQTVTFSFSSIATMKDSQIIMPSSLENIYGWLHVDVIYVSAAAYLHSTAVNAKTSSCLWFALVVGYHNRFPSLRRRWLRERRRRAVERITHGNEIHERVTAVCCMPSPL